MPIEYDVLRKADLQSPATFAEVELIANSFLQFLRDPEIKQLIDSVHVLGASSSEIEAIVLPGAEKLGFTNEKKGLFKAYPVPALRPDYYAKVLGSGILLEVERGKTTTNNMDLLDFWKCHICEHADYLFLLVPQQRPSKNGQILRHFKQVQKRLSTFFIPRNHTNVEAVFIYGY